jgi:hypothetical protein
VKDWRLTVIEGPNHGVVLEILPNSWEIDPHGDIELVQDRCWANARYLEQSRGDDGSGGEDNLFITKHLPAGRLGRSRILPLLA